MNCCRLRELILRSPASKLYRGIIKITTKRKLGKGLWVVFLNPYDQEIGHYTGLYVKDDDEAWFFNSLGYENGYEQVKELLSPFSTTFNVDSLQSRTSDVCALYVIYFFARVAEGATFDEFLNEFGSEPLTNDLYVYTRAKSYYN